MPRLVNMTRFVQRTAQEQALQNPLASSPLPVAAISQGPDWGISSQASTIGCKDWQQPRQSPEKGNSLVSHQLPSCPSHTEVRRGHPALPPRSATFRPGHEHQEKKQLPAMLLPCILHTTQGPRTMWLCLLVCSFANIPLSYQHLLKPVPIRFLA